MEKRKDYSTIKLPEETFALFFVNPTKENSRLEYRCLNIALHLSIEDIKLKWLINKMPAQNVPVFYLGFAYGINLKSASFTS